MWCYDHDTESTCTSLTRVPTCLLPMPVFSAVTSKRQQLSVKLNPFYLLPAKHVHHTHLSERFCNSNLLTTCSHLFCFCLFYENFVASFGVKVWKILPHILYHLIMTFNVTTKQLIRCTIHSQHCFSLINYQESGVPVVVVICQKNLLLSLSPMMPLPPPLDLALRVNVR